MLPVRLNIRSKLILSFFSLVLAITILFTSVFYFRESRSIREEVEKRGNEVVKTFTQMVSSYQFNMEFATILDNAKEIKQSGDILFILTANEEGKVLVHTELSHPQNIMDDYYRQIIDKKQQSSREILFNQNQVLEFTHPIVTFGRVVGIVSVGISLEPVKKKLLDTIITILSLSIGMLVLASLFYQF